MRRRLRRLLTIISLAATIIIALAALTTLPATRQERRLAAQARWEQRPFSNYRLQLQIERLGTTCVEDLLVEDQTVTVLNDGCAIGWLPYLTVPTLFDLGRRLERNPECFPAADCACQRVRNGRVVYDEQLGYPREIVIRRHIRPNWSHPDYWAATLDDWALPTCGSFNTGITVTVQVLTPLP